METLSLQAGLSTAMITITLPSEWHPNPRNGNTKWNDETPQSAHKFFCKKWQAVLRDLHRNNISISGLRVVEPHQDGCPHYHIWTLYRPEHEKMILSTIMKYFPLKLKIRDAADNLSDAVSEIFDTRELFQANQSRPLSKPNEGSQVECARINRTISSGASYAMKYLLKYLPRDKQKGLSGADDSNEQKGRDINGADHDEVAKRVDIAACGVSIKASSSALQNALRIGMSCVDYLRHLSTLISTSYGSVRAEATKLAESKKVLESAATQSGFLNCLADLTQQDVRRRMTLCG